MDSQLQAKYDALRDRMRELRRVAVAFSGGVDSALLLKVAHDELGDDCVAITGDSPSVPARELEGAKSVVSAIGARHVVIQTHEFEIEGFDHNPVDRCYICKKSIFGQIMATAAELGFSTLAEGSNMDDLGDYRPGEQAVAELGVASPLRDAGLYKDDIRALVRELGLPVWDKPSFACLNSRFEYGDLITPQKLEMVDAAESLLQKRGFEQVRVRMAGTSARIEVPPAQIADVLEPSLREEVLEAFEEIGFTHVSVDLKGYRTGSMNEGLNARK